MNAVPLASSMVSLAGMVLLAWYMLRGRRGLDWAGVFFALQLAAMWVGQVLEFLASVEGWSGVGYRLYYFSSPLSAGLLAVGVLHAVGWRRLAWAFLAYTLAVSLVLALRLSEAMLDWEALKALGEEVGGRALPADVRMLSPALTIPSGLASLIAPLVWILGKAPTARGEREPGVARGMAGIVAGNLVFLVAGGLLRQGRGDLFLILELAATVILAASFVLIVRSRRMARTPSSIS